MYLSGKKQLNGRKEPKNRHTLRYWMWEFCSLVLGTGLFVVTVTVLLRYDGQKLPEWPYSININTPMAMMSMMAGACMGFVVAEVIGQLKWIWFARNAGPLCQLQASNDTSRGVVGSLSLVCFASDFEVVLSPWLGPFGGVAHTLWNLEKAAAKTKVRFCGQTNSTTPRFVTVDAGQLETNDLKVEVSSLGCIEDSLDSSITLAEEGFGTQSAISTDQGSGQTAEVVQSSPPTASLSWKAS